jgi:hypothetical protein
LPENNTKQIKNLANLLIITLSQTALKNVHSNEYCMFGHELTVSSQIKDDQDDEP